MQLKNLSQRRVDYSQALTDIIQIFWEVHKKRLDEGEIIFGGQFDGDHCLQNIDGLIKNLV